MKVLKNCARCEEITVHTVKRGKDWTQFVCTKCGREVGIGDLQK